MIRAIVAAWRALVAWLEQRDPTPDRTRLIARFEKLERKYPRW
jgi:hypothetical protein